MYTPCAVSLRSQQVPMVEWLVHALAWELWGRGFEPAVGWCEILYFHYLSFWRVDDVVLSYGCEWLKSAHCQPIGSGPLL